MSVAVLWETQQEPQLASPLRWFALYPRAPHGPLAGFTFCRLVPRALTPGYIQHKAELRRADFPCNETSLKSQ